MRSDESQEATNGTASRRERRKSRRTRHENKRGDRRVHEGRTARPRRNKGWPTAVHRECETVGGTSRAHAAPGRTHGPCPARHSRQRAGHPSVQDASQGARPSGSAPALVEPALFNSSGVHGRALKPATDSADAWAREPVVPPRFFCAHILRFAAGATTLGEHWARAVGVGGAFTADVHHLRKIVASLCALGYEVEEPEEGL
jgi:hypothetical protein